MLELWIETGEVNSDEHSAELKGYISISISKFEDVLLYETKIKNIHTYNGPILLYDYGVILSTFGLRLKFLNFYLRNKKF